MFSEDAEAEDQELAAVEARLERASCLAEIKVTILYGVDLAPRSWDPALLDLSMAALFDVMHFDLDSLARDVIRWQHDTIMEAGMRFADGRWHGKGGADLVLAYRGGGKSTTGTIARGIWYMVRCFDVRMGYVSETENLPKAFLRETKNHLSNNADLIAMFGTFRPEPGDQQRPWDAKISTIRQRRQNHREPTMHAFGIGSQAAGYHYDVLFGDDLVTLEGSRSHAVRKYTSDWYGATFGGLQMQHTISHFLGTPYMPGDLWDEMENGRPDEGAGPLKRATLVVPAERVVNGKRVATSPTRWPLEALDRQIATLGRVHYRTQYLMDRSAMVGSVFNLADFGWYDPADELLTLLRADWLRYAFFDLKAGSKSVGDYFAGMVIAIAPDKTRVDVIDAVHARASMTEQRIEILRLTELHRARTGIEAVQMQTAFAEEVRQFTLLPVEPVKVEGDKVMRALRVAPLIEAHKVWLPKQDSDFGRRLTQYAFFEELVQFPESDHDDLVDALVGALTFAMYGYATASFAGSTAPARAKGRTTQRRASSGKLRGHYS